MTIQLPADTGALKAPIIASINSSLIRAVNDPGIVPWDPAVFVASPADGFWWQGTDIANKWVDSAGSVAVVSNLDPIGRWTDKYNSNPLTQDSTQLKPRWNDTLKCVEFLDSSGGDPLMLMLSGLGISWATPLTLMATIAKTGGTDSTRGVVGLAAFSGNRYFALNPRYTSGKAAGTVNMYAAGTDTLLQSTSNMDSAFTTISFDRDPADRKLKNLYFNGVLENAGSSMQAVDADTLTFALMFGAQSGGSGPILRVKDLIIAFKAATPEDHAGYAAYGATL